MIRQWSISLKSNPYACECHSVSGLNSIKSSPLISACERERIFLPPSARDSLHTLQPQPIAGTPSAAAVPKNLIFITSPCLRFYQNRTIKSINLRRRRRFITISKALLFRFVFIVRLCRGFNLSRCGFCRRRCFRRRSRRLSGRRLCCGSCRLCCGSCRLCRYRCGFCRRR